MGSSRDDVYRERLNRRPPHSSIQIHKGIDAFSKPIFRIKSSMARSAPLPKRTIFVTPRKWSLGSQPVVLQDSIERIIAIRKFSHLAYPRGSCKRFLQVSSKPKFNSFFRCGLNKTVKMTLKLFNDFAFEHKHPLERIFLKKNHRRK